MKVETRSFSGLWALASLALLILLLAGFACNQKQQDTGAKLAAGVAEALSAVDQQATDLHATRAISDGEYAGVETATLVAVRCDQDFTALLRRKAGAVDNDVLWGLDDLRTCLGAIQSQGIAAVQDQTARAALQVAFHAVQVALQTVGENLTNPRPQKTAEHFPISKFRNFEIAAGPVNREGVPDDSYQWIMLIDAAIGLFGAGAALVGKLRGMSGMSDEELLQVADTTNDGTLARIQQHLASLGAPPLPPGSAGAGDHSPAATTAPNSSSAGGAEGLAPSEAEGPLPTAADLDAVAQEQALAAATNEAAATASATATSE